MRRRIGVLGGTFDPVHFGHLRMGLELQQRLALERVHMVVASVPPHRAQPLAAAAHRLAMLERALEKAPGLVADDCELRRNGPSYMVDTLAGLRCDYGEHAAICLAMGADAFAGLASWDRWEQLLDLAHIVVMSRPDAPPLPSTLEQWVSTRWAENSEDALDQAPAGRVLRVQLSQLAISATAIRSLIAQQESPHFLMPEGVIDYIQQHRLYVEQGA